MNEACERRHAAGGYTAKPVPSFAGQARSYALICSQWP